jgi:hypothetical protein
LATLANSAAARDINVEIPHLVERKHAYSVFSFHVTKSFHVNGPAKPERLGG